MNRIFNNKEAEVSKKKGTPARRKILASFLVLTLLLCLVGGITGASFSDQENSVDNSLTSWMTKILPSPDSGKDSTGFGVRAATWNFTTPSDYTYDTDIEVTGGYAQLISTGSPDWWNTDYSYRQQLTVSTGASAVSSGYPVDTTIDTDALETAGKVRSDRKDWRIVYWNGVSNIELDRQYVGTAETWFALQAGIPASSSDNDYYAYYGYAGETTDPPEDLDNIYQKNTYQHGDGGSYSTTEDAFIRKAQPDQICATSDLRTTASDDSNERNILIRFPDLVGGSAGQIPSGATIISANLSLLSLDASSSEHLAYRVIRHWIEGNGMNVEATSTGVYGATWNMSEDYYTGEGTDVSWETPGAYGSTDRESTPQGAAVVPDTAGNWYDFDIMNAVQGWSDGSYANEGILIRQTTTPYDLAKFYDRGNGTQTNRPKLTVYYYDPVSPEPTVNAGTETDVFPSTNPTIKPNTGESYTADITAFTEILGPANEGEARYQISNNGTNWYYHNSSNWVASSGFAQTNTATEVNADIASFDDDVGTGTFYFKAFLSGDGTEQVQLDWVQISYSLVSTSSATWPFTTAGNYTYNGSKIEVTAGQAQLISSATPNWWNANYSYRQQLTVTTGASAVSSGYPVDTTIDTDALETAGKVRSDRKDWRIVYWNGISNVELDRQYAGTAETWFALQAGIPASSSDNDYYAYYGYAGETTDPPADIDNIYQTNSYQHGDGGSYSTTEDAFIRKSIPDNICATSTLRATASDDNNERIILIRFPDLIGGSAGQVPSGATIISASLSLRCENAASNEHLAYRVLRHWIEGTGLNVQATSSGVYGATWNMSEDYYTGEGTDVSWETAGAYGSTDRESTPQGAAVVPDTVGNWYDFDIKNAVQDWADGSANEGVLIRQTTTPYDLSRFYSRDDGTQTNRPQLTVYYYDPVSPEPTVTPGSEVPPLVYPSDNPTIQPNTGESYSTDITEFIETLGPANEGEARYQISNNGTNWYYHDGDSWTSASGFAQTNTAAEINVSIASFDDDVGTGTFYFKAVLSSDSTQQVQLDQVKITYILSTPPPYDLNSTELSYLEDSDDNRYTTQEGWGKNFSDGEYLECTLPYFDPGTWGLLEVHITVEWQRSGDVDGARLKVFDGLGSNQTYDLTIPPAVDTDYTETVDVSGLIGTWTKANGLTVWFQAKASDSADTKHDLVELIVTYSQ